MRAINKNALKGLCIAVIGASLVAVTVLTGCKGETTTVTVTTTSTFTIIIQPTDSDVIPSISTDELSEQIGNSDWVIVDLRSKASYNGWKLFGEERGGHIKGAVDFPISWTTNVTDLDLKQNLENQGITPDKNVVVYHVNASDGQAVAYKFKSLGYSNLYIYEDIKDWAADETLPMESLAHYEKLISVEWVNELIQGNNPATYNGNKYIILEVSWGPPEGYNEGHIPGSIHLDTDEIESLPLWNFLSDDVLEEKYKKLGIDKDTLVITYGKSSSAAARVLIGLMRAGVEDVRLLDGGWNAWVDGGFTIEIEAHEPVAVADFGTTTPAHPEYVIDTEQLKESLGQSGFVLTSIRRWEEFIGEISGYSYIEPKSEIPGAAWGHNTRDFRDQDGKMLNYHQIAAMWEEWGITPDKTVSFYCGTGWRASLAWFYAYLMGWEDISIYDGGWFEWSMDPANPVQIGDPR